MLEADERDLGVVNPHIKNPNGSNSIHILFANFSFDEESAQSLLLKLI